VYIPILSSNQIPVFAPVVCNCHGHVRRDAICRYSQFHNPHNNAPDELYELYPSEELELRPNVTPEQEERTRNELPGYYAHCTAIDSCVGDVFKTLEESGILENTIFVFTADHGDMHGSQGKNSWRKQVPWNEAVCVPFLMHYPAIHEGGRTMSTTLNTPEILPSLLSLAGVEIPESIEGDDISDILKGREEDPTRAGLFMSVSPFAGKLDFKAYRGVRTSRYSYVCDSDGPWLLYDNQEDPYQMKNLVNNPEFADLQDRLDSELHRQLKQNNDSLTTSEEACEKWGYQVAEKSGEIPYCGEFKVQSPGPDKGKVCSFPN